MSWSDREGLEPTPAALERLAAERAECPACAAPVPPTRCPTCDAAVHTVRRERPQQSVSDTLYQERTIAVVCPLNHEFLAVSSMDSEKP